MVETKEMLKYVPTTCPYCGVGCGLNLVVSEGKLVGVEPYKRSPINEGKLCPKGMTCWEHVQSPDRLTTPKIKKNGKFVDATWDEAIDLIAKKFKETSDKFGPKSLGFQTSCRTVNEDCYALQKLARVGFQTNNVDNCARICHGPSVAGLSLSFGSGAATNPFEDVLNSDLIVMWGSNAVEAHPLAGRRVMQAKKKGIPIVVVDPRFSATARLADKWIRFNPSTHIALANNMMYYIIKEGLEDKEFIKERTKGFDDLKKTVEKYADATKIHGVPHETVKEFARQYAKAKNAVIIYCLGITELTTGTDNVRSMGNLSLLTGNIGRPGVGVNPLRGQNNVQGACDMGAYPNVFSGYQAVAVADNRAKMEKAWGMKEGSLPDWYGVDPHRADQRRRQPGQGNVFPRPEPGRSPTPIRTMSGSSSRNSTSASCRISSGTRAASMRMLSCPAPALPRRTGHSPAASAVSTVSGRPLTAPASRSTTGRSSVWLPRRLGLKGFDWKTAKDVWDDMRACTPGQFGVTYEKMEKPESIHWPCPTIEHPGTPILHIGKFSAADGKGTMFGLEYRPPAEVADAQYPFTLMTGRVIFHYHTRTQTDRAKQLHYEVPESYIQINTEDAKQMGIKEGEKIKVTSRRGETITKARVTDDVAPKVLYMAMHFHNGANNLTNTALDPLSKMPELKHCAVKVEKIAEAK